MSVRLAQGLLTGMLLALLLCACSSSEPVTPAVTVHTVTDAAGRSVAMPVWPPKRIVTLSPEATELAFWLQADDRVVGVSRFSNYPAATKDLPKVGGYTDFNVEAIAALRPDLVIGTIRGNPKDLVHVLETASVPVFVMHADGFEGIPATLRTLAALLYAPGPDLQRISSLIDTFETTAARTVSGARKRIASAGFAQAPGVVMLQYEPPIVAGADTLLDGLLTESGLINIGGRLKGRYPLVSAEALAALKPRVLLAVRMTSSGLSVQQKVQRLRLGSPVVCELDPDTSTRATPRFLLSIEALVSCLEAAAGNTP